MDANNQIAPCDPTCNKYALHNEMVANANYSLVRKVSHDKDDDNLIVEIEAYVAGHDLRVPWPVGTKASFFATERVKGLVAHE